MARVHGVTTTVSQRYQITIQNTRESGSLSITPVLAVSYRSMSRQKMNYLQTYESCILLNCDEISRLVLILKLQSSLSGHGAFPRGIGEKRGW
jgi:hypothetical protein